MTDVKFCGMTRPEDLQRAAALGAAFVGVVLTRSPRRVTPDAARELLGTLQGSAVRRVGVFGAEPVGEVVAAARTAGVDVVQLHGTRPRQDFMVLRQELGLETWRVVRVGAEGLSRRDREEFGDGDATLLDTLSNAALGGTGRTFDWGLVAGQIRPLRGAQRLIVAGGLRPGNVRDVIEWLRPDVVDVSSGVETSPGVKDHRLMAEFMAAASAARTGPG